MLVVLSFAVFTIFIPHALSENDRYCRWVISKNCMEDPIILLCGTDGLTYNNNCYLAKDYCKNGNTHLAYGGQCTTRPTPTTSTTTTSTTTVPTTTQAPINGGLIALDIFCLDLAYIHCTPDGTTVCATNGVFYKNLCEFDKARCTHRDIHSNGTNCH